MTRQRRRVADLSIVMNGVPEPTGVAPSLSERRSDGTTRLAVVPGLEQMPDAELQHILAALCRAQRGKSNAWNAGVSRARSAAVVYVAV